MDIKEIIKQDIINKQNKYVARKYYYYTPNSKVDINTYQNGEIHTFKDNSCELYTNYFKLLVNQKIDYLLSKEPELNISDSVFTAPTVVSMLEDVMLNAALDSASWLHFYVDNNELNYIIIPDKEIIPLYDNYNKNIIGIIRYFLIKDDENKKYRVEQWDKSGVRIDILDIDNSSVTNNEILHHYKETTYYQGEIENVEGKNLPFIPFIPMFNNKAKTSDIDGIKELLDMYNSINSGFVDNIDLFQEAIVKLKGFTGDSEELETIRKNIKKYKMVGIPNGGSDNADMEYMAVEIPVEARKTILDILKENIFKIGQGMDPDKFFGESNLTNVVIKSRYTGLDMKSNGTQKQAKLFYEKFIDCINKFKGVNNSKDITFNKSMIFNESEAIDNCLKSMNLLDLETVLDNHPWVKDSKKVIKKLEKEREENIKRQQELMKDNEMQVNNMSTNDIKDNNVAI